ncbi:MAG: OmpW family outer membrane protein [Pseudomonadota bacterium]|jgi:outer membrane protein
MKKQVIATSLLALCCRRAGVDIPVAKNTYLNFDIKKPYISTEVSSAGARIGTFRIDPILFGVGLGWCF